MIGALVGVVSRGEAQGPPPDTTSGFAITDATVMRRCAGCHARDSAGGLSRLSFMRKTPEGWEASVRRMVTLNNVRLEPAEARAIVRYLSNQQGLAPSELTPGRFETERRAIDFRYTADAPTERTCRACHSMGRVITQRRTRGEWELLIATHRGYYPLADFQAFRRTGPPNPDSAGAPHPMDQAIGHLARTFPLRTPEWAAWSATMRPAPLAGTWVLSGYETGRGAFYGRAVITPVPGTDDEFTTRSTYRFAAGGAMIERTGRSIVYTGHQWRGRSSTGGTAPDSTWREVLSVEPGWQEVTGRWFRGGYDEFGMDVTLRRAGGGPTIAGVSPRALRPARGEQTLTIHGDNLPNASVRDVSFGPGITVRSVTRPSPEEIVVRLTVDSSARSGARDLFAAGAALRGAVVVYDRVDRIRVAPLAGMARVGGVRFPKQFARFEAVGYLNGADAKPETPDDIEIGPLPVTWALEEYGVTFKDDDLTYVGSIDSTGLFTPNVDGPNPQRPGNRNNIGDVWVVATYRPEQAAARALRARAHLVVTVPLYMRWEPARTAP